MAAASPRYALTEKRKCPRLAVRLPVIYHSLRHVQDSYLLNICQGGAFIECSILEGVGSRVSIRIALSGGATLTVAARVIWHEEGPHRGMGLCFQEMDRSHRAALADFLLSLVSHISGSSHSPF
jgi:hypothetical protein